MPSDAAASMAVAEHPTDELIRLTPQVLEQLDRPRADDEGVRGG